MNYKILTFKNLNIQITSKNLNPYIWIYLYLEGLPFNFKQMWLSNNSWRFLLVKKVMNKFFAMQINHTEFAHVHLMVSLQCWQLIVLEYNTWRSRLAPDWISHWVQWGWPAQEAMWRGDCWNFEDGLSHPYCDRLESFLRQASYGERKKTIINGQPQ